FDYSTSSTSGCPIGLPLRRGTRACGRASCGSRSSGCGSRGYGGRRVSGTICRNGPKGAAHQWFLTPSPLADGLLIQPVLLFEFSGQVLLGQVLEILVGEGVQFVFEPAREHPLDFLLP